jgi:outer membrane lipoprotein carrier protein
LALRRRGTAWRRLLPLAIGAAVALALLAGGARPAGAAADTCKGDLMERVQKAYQAVSAFQGRFEQEDHQSDGRTASAKGEVAYLKPGRMRWRYEPPDEQLLVTDGKTVWLFDPLLDNVTVQPLSDLTQGTPLAFLLGVGNLQEDFACRAFTRPPPPDGLTYLELVPRKPIPALAYIQLGVRPGSDRIASLRMVDTQDNLRWVRFSELKTGVTFPAGTFTFLVPQGMEVISKGSP